MIGTQVEDVSASLPYSSNVSVLKGTYWSIKSASFVHGQVSARETAFDSNNSNIHRSYL